MRDTSGAQGAPLIRPASAARFVRIEYPASMRPNTYYLVANIRGTQRIIGNFSVPSVALPGAIAVPVSCPGPFKVAGNAAALDADGSIALFAQSATDNKLSYDTATTSVLGAAGTVVSSISGA